MVIGAYTVITTVGMLTGLPLSAPNAGGSQTNYNVSTNNIYDIYYGKYFNSEFTLSANGYLALDCSNSAGGSVVVYSNYTQYNYSFNEKVGNYDIYKFSSQSTSTKTNLINFSLSLSSSTDPVTINQAYLLLPTNKMSSIDGDSIISSITSGLGLMGDIITNFKNGFSALIWNSEKNSLTTFGNFALIFLGVSIAFAIVELCLNLIRSKTGA